MFRRDLPVRGYPNLFTILATDLVLSRPLRSPSSLAPIRCLPIKPSALHPLPPISHNCPQQGVPLGQLRPRRPVDLPLHSIPAIHKPREKPRVLRCRSPYHSRALYVQRERNADSSITWKRRDLWWHWASHRIPRGQSLCKQRAFYWV